MDYRSLFYYYPAPESGVAWAESSPDGRHILVASHRGRTYLLNADSGRWRTGPGGGGGEITCAAFSPDGSLVLLGRADTAELWRVPKFPAAPASAGDEVHRFVHAGFVYAARFSPDGQCALTGGFDRALRLWDVSRGTEISRYQGSKPWDIVNDLAWLPDGATVTLALHSLSDSGGLRPWDQPDKLVKHEWTSPPAISLLATNAQRIAIAPDGKTFFSGGVNGECWEMHEQSGDQRYNPSLRPTHSMAISPDGRRAVSAAGLEEGAVRVWHCRGRCGVGLSGLRPSVGP